MAITRRFAVVLGTLERRLILWELGSTPGVAEKLPPGWSSVCSAVGELFSGRSVLIRRPCGLLLRPGKPDSFKFYNVVRFGCAVYRIGAKYWVYLNRHIT